MSETPTVVIKPALSLEEKHHIYQFRYHVYIEEMNRVQKYADHQAKTIHEPLDDTAILFSAYIRGDMVGTIRLNYAKRGGLDYYPTLYDMFSIQDGYADSSITTKLLVAKRYRASIIVRGLIFRGYQQLLDDGLRYNYIDVNAHLVNFFKRFGYQYLKPINHPEFGEVSLMRIHLDNAYHLQELNSPFYPLLKKHLEKNQPIYHSPINHSQENVYELL